MTPPEQRDINTAVQRDARMRFSPLARSRYPLDGPLGLLSILLLIALLVATNISVGRTVMEGRLKVDGMFITEGVAFNVGALSMIGWMIGVRLTNRRARRQLSGRCPSCDYDLRGNASGTCPECGRIITNR